MKTILKGTESVATVEEVLAMATHRMAKVKKEELASILTCLTNEQLDNTTVVFVNRGFEINTVEPAVEPEPAIKKDDVPMANPVPLQFPASTRPGFLEYLEWNMETNECIRIPAPYSDCRRWCEAHGYNDPLIVVDHAFNKDRVDLQQLLEEAIDNGIAVNGKHYVDVFASPSNIRNASSVFMDEAIAQEYMDWAVSGTDISSLPSVKQAQAWTLLLSTTTMFSKMFPNITVPKFRDSYIGEDLEFVHKDIPVIKFVDDTYTEVVEDVTDTSSDGQAYIVINDFGMSQEQLQTILAEVRGCSLRYPGVKVSAQFILASAIVHAMLYNSVEEFVDAYGHTFNKNHLPSIIMFKSGFKLSKVIKTKEQLEAFMDRCDAMNHKFSVCITEHNPSRDLPAQALQSMDFNVETAKELADKAYNTIHEFMGTKSGLIVGGSLGRAVDMFPALRGDFFFQDTWNSGMKNYIHRQLGGRFPKVTRYHIVSQDPFAVLQHIFGVEVTGLIPDGCIICNYPGYKINQELGTYRMPNNDNNISIVRKMAVPKNWKGLYLGNSAFVSVQSTEMLLKQMDFDGDKIGIFKDKDLICLAKKSIAGRKPLALRPLAKPEPKDKYTNQDWKEFDKGIISSPVGLCANAAAQAYACLPKDKLRKELYYLSSEMSTLVIDRAKNPDDKGAARNAEELITSISPKLGYAMFDKNGALKNTKMPRFQAWAKSSWLNDDHEWERRLNSTSFAPMSGVDWYSQLLRILLYGRNGMDESNVKLEQTVEWVGERTGRSVARMLCASEYGRCVIEGFNTFYVNLVRTATEEYKTVMSKSVSQRQAQSTWTAQYVYDQCVAFVRNTMPDATTTQIIRKLVSALATFLYSRVNDFHANEDKRIFWQVFGEIVIQVLQENLKANLWETIQKEELEPKGMGVNFEGFVDNGHFNPDELPEINEDDYFSSDYCEDEENVEC